MATEIENRVVEMRFDNAEFEKGISKSISSIQTLNESIGDGESSKNAKKNAKAINAAIKSVDFNPILKALDEVNDSVNSLTSLSTKIASRIKDSIIDAGTSLAKSLSVDQLSTGWTKYTEKTGSVQTLLNSTGKSLDEVNGYLEELMWYSDETSFGFTDMTSALATMTASGGEIENLIPMIEGMANSVAYAGKGASEFSRVIYNLNQSYSQGYLSLMDWKSVQNASAASSQLIQELIAAGEELGTIEEGEVTLGNFTSTLSDKWATSEVMEKAFGKFSEFTQAVKEAVDNGEYETATDAIAAMSENYDELGVTAFTAAQSAKSFEEAVDATKDAVSSGWMKTYEIIFGDYEEAKALWTDVANILYDLFAAWGETRNEILSSAFSDTFSSFREELQPIASLTSSATKHIGTLIDAYGGLDEIVENINAGMYSSSDELRAAVEALGVSYEDVEDELKQRIAIFDGLAEAETELSDSERYHLMYLSGLNDEELESAGYSKAQIKQIRQLTSLAKKLNIPLNTLLKNLDNINGRWVLLEGIKNIGEAISNIFDIIAESFTDVMGWFTNDEASDAIFDIVAAFHSWTVELKKFTQNKENVDKLKRTFTGLFNAISVVKDILSGAFSIAWRVVSGVLKEFDLDILDVTASVGDALTEFKQWVDESGIVEVAINSIVSVLVDIITQIKLFIDSINGVEGAEDKLSDFAKLLKDIYTSGVEWFAGLGDAWDGFIERTKNVDEFSLDNVLDILNDFRKNVLGYVFDFDSLFENIKTNFLNFLNKGASTSAGKFFTKISNALKFIDGYFKQVATSLKENVGVAEMLALIFSAAVVKFMQDFASWVNTWMTPIEAITGVINSVKKVFTNASTAILAYAQTFKAQSILYLAAALIAMASSLYILAKIPEDRLLSAAGTLTILAVAITVMAIAVSKFGKAESTLDLKEGLKVQSSLSSELFNLSLAMLAMAGILKLIDSYDINAWPAVLTRFIEVVAVFVVAVTVVNVLAIAVQALQNKINGPFSFDSKSLLNIYSSLLIFASSMVLFAAAFALIVKAMKGVRQERIISAMIVFGVILVAFAGLLAISVYGKREASVFTKNTVPALIGAALGIVAVIVSIKLAIGVVQELEQFGIWSALKTLGLIIASMLSVFILSRTVGDQALGAAAAMLAIAFAISRMSAAIKVFSTLDHRDLTVATVAVMALIAMFGVIGLFFKSREVWTVLDNKQTGKKSKMAGEIKGLAATFIAIGAAITALIAAVVIFSHIDIGSLLKAVLAVDAIIIAFGVMARLTSTGTETKLDYKGMTAMIGALALLMASFIVISILAKNNANNMILGAAMIVSILLAYSHVLREVSNLKDIQSGPILSLALVVLMLGAALAVVSKSNWESILSAGAAMSLILLTLGHIVEQLSAFGKKQINPSSIATLISLSIVMGIIGVVLGAVSNFMTADWATILATGVSIAGILYVLGDIAVKLAKFDKKQINPSVIANLTLLSLAVAAVGAALNIAGMSNADWATTLANGVSIAGILYVLGDIAVKLAKFDKKVINPSIIANLAALSGVMVIIAAVLWAMGALKVDNALENAAALSLVLVVVSGICALLSALGVNVASATNAALGLVSFMAILIAVIALLGGVFGSLSEGTRETILAGIDFIVLIFYKLGEMVTAIISGLGAGLTLGLPEMGVNIELFSESIKRANENFEGVSSETGAAVESFASALLAFTGAELVNGLAEFFDILSGDDGSALFESRLTEIGKGLNNFVTELPEDTDWVQIDYACKALLSLIEALDSIPDDGEGAFDKIGQWLGGGDGTNKFKNRIITLADGLSGFSTTISGIKFTNFDSAMSACNSIMDLCDRVPKKDGVLQKITGQADENGFGNSLATLGGGFSNFVDATKEIDWTTIDDTTTGAEKIIDICNLIPEEGGLLGGLLGENDPGSFGAAIGALGSGLADFASYSSGVSDWGAVDKATNAFEKLSTVIDAIGENNYYYGISSISDFVDCLETLGEASVDGVVEAFENSYEDLEAAIGTMIGYVTSINSVYIPTMTSKMESFLASVATEVKASTSIETNYKPIGAKLMIHVGNGIMMMEKATTLKITGIFDRALDAVEADDWYTVGVNAMIGFSNGMADQSTLISTTAYNAGDAVVKASMDALDENSPSKVMQTVGEYAMEGLALGISAKGNVATDAMNAALTDLKDDIDNYFDTNYSNFEYGTDALTAYINMYGNLGTSMEDNKKSIDAAAESMRNYAQYLYETSDQYETDNEQMEEHKKNLEDLYAQRAELMAQQEEAAETTEETNETMATSNANYVDQILAKYPDLQSWYNQAALGYEYGKNKLAEFASTLGIEADAVGSSIDELKTYLLGEDVSLTSIIEAVLGIDLSSLTDTLTETTDTTATQLETLNEQIADAEQQLVEDTESAAEHVKEAYAAIASSISDSVSDFLDVMSIEVDTGIDLFSKFEDAADDASEATTTSTESIVSDPFAEVEEETEEEEDKLTRGDLLKNMQAQANQAIAYTKKLAKLETAEGISDSLKEYLKGLGIDGMEYIDLFLSMTEEELEKANAMYASTLQTTEEESEEETENVLDNLKSQYDGYLKWQETIQKLRESGLDSGLVDEIEALGIDGLETAEGYLALSAAQIKEANTTYEGIKKIEGQSLLNQQSSLIDSVDAWSTKLQTLSEKDIPYELYQKLVDAGPSDTTLLDYLIDMSDEDLKTFFTKYNEALTKASSTGTDVSAMMQRVWEKDDGTASTAEEKGKEDGTAYANGFANALAGNTTSTDTATTSTSTSDSSTSSSTSTTAATSEVAEDTADTLTTEDNTSKWKNAAGTLISSFAEGIKEHASEAVAAVKSMADSVITTFNSAMAAGNITVRPVVTLDDSSILAINGFTATISGGITSWINNASSMTSSIIESNNKVIESVEGLRSDIQSIVAANGSEISLYVDSKKLASSLAKPIDTALARQNVKGRY